MIKRIVNHETGLHRTAHIVNYCEPIKAVTHSLDQRLWVKWRKMEGDDLGFRSGAKRLTRSDQG